jgi:16S rRNA (uracil1498-N3)-methyltransferase
MLSWYDGVMRIHRFYVGDTVELKHDFWLHDERLIWQWRKVLRMQVGQELVLFDGVRADRLYRLLELTEREAHLELITDFVRKTPVREVYLLWSLLKKDKNDWVIQKATEIGVSHFVPLLAERSEKTGFDADRARKIVIEAAEQCGRSDIPSVRDAITVTTALNELRESVALYICEQGSDMPASQSDEKPNGVLIGPEGGWSDTEKQLFKENGLPHIGLGEFTFRAETAAVVASSKLV